MRVLSVTLVLLIKISADPVAILAVPILALLLILAELVARLLFAEAMINPGVVSSPKLAEPEASTEPTTSP